MLVRLTSSTSPSSRATSQSRPSAFLTTVPTLESKRITRSPSAILSPSNSSGTSLSCINLGLTFPSCCFSRSTSICCHSSYSSSDLMMSSLISSSRATSASILPMSARISSSSSFFLSTSCASLEFAPTLKTPDSMTNSPMRSRALALLIIRSSTVPGVMSRITNVCFFCPMRLILAFACSSIIGFQSLSKMITVSAVWRLTP
mmetsp:Transcript_31216/g.70258  ORF Transcript_31216/g.70258 Transcript_31216/m.70258 type:complete len:203 (-) Transcript_31216:58-666(-)